MPPQIRKDRWYSRLLFDVERSGLFLLEASLAGRAAGAAVVGNDSQAIWTDAIAKFAALADLHLPASVRTVYFIVESRSQDCHYRRASAIKLN